jgi:arylsulfatase A-like enzyme
VLDPRSSQSKGEASDLVAALDARLGTIGDGPAFLFTHFMDAHFPYDKGRADGSPKDRFVSELSIVDREIGRLRRVLARLPIASRTTLIVTADHGEAFGEHGRTQHGTTVYEELLRVPLLIRSPGVAPREVSEPVSLVDLAPTILDLNGIATPGSYMGQSLVPFLRGASPALTRPILAEGRLKRALIFPDGMKAITDERRGTVELYDLVNDPKELRNLASEGAADVEARVGALDTFFAARGLDRHGYKPPYRP